MSFAKKSKYPQQQQQQQQKKQQQKLKNKQPFKVNGFLESKIMKEGVEVNHSAINHLIHDMVNRKMRSDECNPDPFGCRHYSCFFRGQSKWWEKGGFGGELYS
jgi:hypothetical protein